jgi:anti-sigma regulatory factor (Ser/Thr protein kinase)
VRLVVALLTVAIRREHDILLLRQRGRQIGQFLGFSTVDIVRITTALSEMARNAFEYGGGGSVAFGVETQAADRQELVIRVQDKGAGIADVQRVLSPSFKSRTGMGIGIKGSRSLMDRFTITSAPGKGTTVVMAKFLPWAASKFTPADAGRLAMEISKSSEATPFGEMQTQNQALLAALQELTERQAEVEFLQRGAWPTARWSCANASWRSPRTSSGHRSTQFWATSTCSTWRSPNRSPTSRRITLRACSVRASTSSV